MLSSCSGDRMNHYNKKTKDLDLETRTKRSQDYNKKQHPSSPHIILKEKFASPNGSLVYKSMMMTTAKSSSLFDLNTTTTTSSCQQDGKKVAVDIWHPDFWSTVFDVVLSSAEISEAEDEEGLNHGSCSSSRDRAVVCTSEKDQPQVSNARDDIFNKGFPSGSGYTKDRTGPSLSSEVFPSSSADLRESLSLDSTTCCGDSKKGSVKGRTTQTKPVGPPSSSKCTHTATKTKPNKENSRNTTKRGAAVTFSCVQIRHYERILDDNPSCRIGLSIGIGWNYIDDKPLSIDAWEASAPDRHRHHRTRNSAEELVLSRSKRERLVRSLGYSDREIAATMREIKRVQYNRRQTVNNLGLQHIEEAMESASRLVQKALLAKRLQGNNVAYN